ncbi:mechanosensitive ion channel domain-containing protein [Agrococcus sp. Marseille-P2731]|uniref:mechanosensitive ion channel domain-containing protein n=1 Tax=Agrococcus sp. Marseille-P2731 TaxID=1841862 RepID=UPI0009303174|nr:mechanosensitive ion channel family protein [Agrococcus sp. Marseille-P2731]
MSDLAGDWVWWAVGIAAAGAILLVVLTEIVNALQRRGHPGAKPLRFLRTWVLPVAGLFALLAFGLRSPEEHVWTRIVATVLGFLVILLVLSAFNVALFSTAKEGTWRERIPSIFVELARLVLVVVGLGLLLQWVWGADVGGLITALGVTSIVIGLALQNAVGGVISGLLLLFEQPFKIGDWLDAQGAQGRVVEVNWRAVHIDTGSGIQIVPNATLSGATFRNLSRPAGSHQTVVEVAFSTDDPPNEVVGLLTQLAEALPMHDDRGRVSAEYRGAAKYAVTLVTASPALADSARSLYLSWLWYAARRRGFALDGDDSDPVAEPAAVEAAIAAIATTLRAGEDERALLAQGARLERWGLGETVQPEGVVPDAVRFVIAGSARTVVGAGAAAVEVDRIEPGDYVGQTALTRERASATVIASSPLTVLVVPLATLNELIGANPRLAQELGRAIEAKRARVVAAQQQARIRTR